MTATLDLSAPALLDRAATHLETVGWTQRQYVRYEETDVLGERIPFDQRAVCPRGAIAVAAGVHPRFGVSWPSYRNGVEDAEGVLAAIWAAERALSDRLRPQVPPEAYGPDVIQCWNDADWRVRGEVVAELRACASALRKAGGGP